MPRYALRTLIVVMLLGGPAVAALWWWPAIGMVAGSLLLAVGVLLASLGLHAWQHHRIQSRMKVGESSALAIGWN